MTDMYCAIQKKVYVVGYSGEIQGVYDSISSALLSGKHPTPILELDALSVMKINDGFKIMRDDFLLQDSIIVSSVGDWYRSRGVFGPYGDIIQVNCLLSDPCENGASYIGCSIDFMGRRAFHKPGLAADIVPFVRDIDGNLFFVGIIRGKNPGKGKVALCGGFTDIIGYKKETGAECAIREAEEEISLVLVPHVDDVRQFANPNADFLNVSVQLSGVNKQVTTMKLLGTYVTSDEEKLDDLGIKRIYETTAYALMIKADDRKLSADEVVSMFIAKDDAFEIVAIPFDKLRGIEFAFGHHRTICDDAMKYIEGENTRYNIKHR